MKTTKIFYSGDIIEHDGAAFQCICADTFAAVFGQVEGESGTPEGERGCTISYENLFVLSNEGPKSSDNLLITSVKEVNMKGFRSREPILGKAEFQHRITFRNSFAYDQGAGAIIEE